MSDRKRILMVEDEPEIRAMTAALLEQEGFVVDTASDGAEMDTRIAAQIPDLVLLDLMLPGEDGLSICRRLQSYDGVRVLMLTAKGTDIDRIIGLELGADDYLPKPFNPRELVARIRAVLRRDAATAEKAGALLEFSGWRLDLGARNLTSPDGEEIEISTGEFNMLSLLLRNPRQVMDRDRLMDETRGREATPFDRTIDVQVSRLRRKLGDSGDAPRIIKTVRGGGYMLAVPVRKLGG